MMCKGYPYYQKDYVDKTLESWERYYYDSSLCIERCDFELRPVWSLRTDGYDTKDVDGELYYIDAVTEEVSKIR